MTLSDKIEKQVTLKAPVSRVWQAVASAREFGRWFGVELDGEFKVGQPIKGVFRHAMTEQGIQDLQKQEGLPTSKVKVLEGSFAFCTPERMEPERYFSFRWMPYGVDAEADPEHEPKTLVEFSLEATPGGTLLTIRESGFDQVPAHRRERAFRMNDGGWTKQAENVKEYVEEA